MGERPTANVIIYKEYRPVAPGIRFKRRAYWPHVIGMGRLNVTMRACVRYGSLGSRSCRPGRRGMQSKCRVVDWWRLYEVVGMRMAIQYAKQQAGGLALCRI